MALNKSALQSGLNSLFDNLYSDTTRTPAEARAHYSAQLANLLDDFVKSGTPKVNGTGLTAGSVAVTGTTLTGTIE